MSLLLMGKENVELGKVMCFPLALKIVEKSKEKREDVGEEGRYFLLAITVHCTMYMCHSHS